MKYPKLPKAFKRKWVSALRSGKFKQGTSYLESEDDDGNVTHCCLGVACAIQGVKSNHWSFIETRSKKIPAILKDDHEAQLDQVLAIKNDNGWSFKRIATWIEKHL